MFLRTILTALLGAVLVAAQTDSSVLAVFILARHGDRTTKFQGIGVEGNSVLTTLGASQVYASGQFFRNKYLNSTSSDYIQNISASLSASQFYSSAAYVLE